MHLRTLLLALLFAPLAAGHGAPVVLDNEVLLVQDEGSDDQYVMDGWDLQFLYARQAFLGDQDGVVFRIAATSGPIQPTWGPYVIEFDLAVNGTTYPIQFTSTDGTGWTGDFEVLEEYSETIEGGILEINFQGFVPLAAIGASHNDTLAGFPMKSYAKQDLIDVAPGGYYAPTVGDLVELTHWGVGAIVQDALVLSGPTDYVATTFDNGTLVVESLITVAGQHVMIEVGESAGWHLETGNTAISANPGETVEFPLEIHTIGTASLPLTVYTDLGGKNVYYLTAGDNGIELGEKPMTAPAAEPADEESPSFAIGMLLIAFAVLALRRR